MVVSFEIPPHDPTATRLLAQYRAEQNRLKELFGPPKEETTEIKAPSEVDRYEWLARARSYLRVAWVIDDAVTITLWLYGTDEGIVLKEVYERRGRD